MIFFWMETETWRWCFMPWIRDGERRKETCFVILRTWTWHEGTNVSSKWESKLKHKFLPLHLHPLTPHYTVGYIRTYISPSRRITLHRHHDPSQFLNGSWIMARVQVMFCEQPACKSRNEGKTETLFSSENCSPFPTSIHLPFRTLASRFVHLFLLSSTSTLHQDQPSWFSPSVCVSFAQAGYPERKWQLAKCYGGNKNAICTCASELRTMLKSWS